MPIVAASELHLLQGVVRIQSKEFDCPRRHSEHRVTTDVHRRLPGLEIELIAAQLHLR
jgi:hypothetical protein